MMFEELFVMFDGGYLFIVSYIGWGVVWVKVVSGGVLSSRSFLICSVLFFKCIDVAYFL